MYEVHKLSSFWGFLSLNVWAK